MSPAVDQRPIESSTVRVYKDDATAITELAALTGGGTVASVFRDVCMPAIRAKLIERAESRVRQLRDTDPQFANALTDSEGR